MPLLRHTKKRFLLYPIYEIANFFTKRVKQSKNAHACRISTPRQGVSISDKAWEWTVYFFVWRLAMPVDR